MKQCCEGGDMSAGCYHDNCKGPAEYVKNPAGGYALYKKKIGSFYVYRESAHVTNKDLERGKQ